MVDILNQATDDELHCIKPQRRPAGQCSAQRRAWQILIHIVYSISVHLMYVRFSRMGSPLAEALTGGWLIAGAGWIGDDDDGSSLMGVEVEVGIIGTHAKLAMDRYNRHTYLRWRQIYIWVGRKFFKSACAL